MKVAYELDLLKEQEFVDLVFHVSLWKKCISDLTSVMLCIESM